MTGGQNLFQVKLSDEYSSIYQKVGYQSIDIWMKM